MGDIPWLVIGYVGVFVAIPIAALCSLAAGISKLAHSGNAVRIFWSLGVLAWVYAGTVFALNTFAIFFISSGYHASTMNKLIFVVENVVSLTFGLFIAMRSYRKGAANAEPARS